MKPDLFRLSIHALKSHGQTTRFTTGNREISTCRDVELYAQFDTPLDLFAKRLIAEFDATYEYDGSFAFFLEGEAISGTLVGGGENLTVVELFGCTNAKSLERFLELFEGFDVIIQIVELGVFVLPSEMSAICE